MNSFKDFFFDLGCFLLSLILVPLAGYCVAWLMGFVAGAVFGVPICTGLNALIPGGALSPKDLPALSGGLGALYTLMRYTSQVLVIAGSAGEGGDCD